MDYPWRTRTIARGQTFAPWFENANSTSCSFELSGIGCADEIKEISGDHELVFIGDHNYRKPMSENTVNKALRAMGYDTTVEVCGHGFRAMACSALIESGLWSKDAVERQMSHQERNSVRAAYIHKAEHLDERKLMLQWWADYLDLLRIRQVSPFDFKKT